MRGSPPTSQTTIFIGGRCHPPWPTRRWRTQTRSCHFTPLHERTYRILAEKVGLEKRPDQSESPRRATWCGKWSQKSDVRRRSTGSCVATEGGKFQFALKRSCFLERSLSMEMDSNRGSITHVRTHNIQHSSSSFTRWMTPDTVILLTFPSMSCLSVRSDCDCRRELGFGIPGCGLPWWWHFVSPARSKQDWNILVTQMTVSSKTQTHEKLSIVQNLSFREPLLSIQNYY